MREIFTAQKSHKRLVFRIHKELLKFNNNTNHSLKMVKQALRKEDVGMANDHMRRCSQLFGTQDSPQNGSHQTGKAKCDKGTERQELPRTAGKDTKQCGCFGKVSFLVCRHSTSQAFGHEEGEQLCTQTLIHECSRPRDS